MRITLSPKNDNEINDIPPSVNGDIITYRGESYDLAQLPSGGEVEADEPFVGKIKRDEQGVVHVTLQYRYCTDTAELMQSTDINDYIFDVTSGECPCPIKRKPVEQEDAE